MPNVRKALGLAFVVISIAAVAQTQAPTSQNSKRSASGNSAQSSNPTAATGPTRGMTVQPNAPREQSPSAAAAAATSQATNPYYGSTMAANPQAGGCGSAGDDLNACQLQMASLNRERTGLTAQQRSTQQRIAQLQASGNSGYDTQISQLQTRVDNLAQQISSLDARIAAVRDRMRQLRGQSGSATSDKKR